ncbi:hypothetical protein RR49_00301 [Microbacterium ginsengisoli]|uniref:Uncharacterized protein n=1 Tax=Microbacterium ginsengisoli TaxID=400772 RepID=A0A0F0LXG7_9MICO|nr:hypothetical protein [Microbacterium ginsengisoli]KJL42004.1 hypothetical protein RR49_00301 [Microbacterium ginsengisoli]MBN9209594.1 hypothetical protein [Microbacterium ginsengisoli]
MIRHRLAIAAAAVVGCLVVGAATVGAARSPEAPTGLCIPLLMNCSTPTPTPTPSPSQTSGSLLPGLPLLPGLGGGSTSPTTPTSPGTPTTPTQTNASWGQAIFDQGAPTLTKYPAQLGAQGLSFTGLKGIALVTVRTVDGTLEPAIRISADSVTVQGFSLTVRQFTGPSLATTADSMTLSGDAQVYLSSLTAVLPTGQAITIGQDTPPPADGITSLLRVTFGLLGATAHNITYPNTHQSLTDG